jgi:hypothetical protein
MLIQWIRNLILIRIRNTGGNKTLTSCTIQFNHTWVQIKGKHLGVFAAQDPSNAPSLLLDKLSVPADEQSSHISWTKTNRLSVLRIRIWIRKDPKFLAACGSEIIISDPNRISDPKLTISRIRIRNRMRNKSVGSATLRILALKFR